MATINVSSRIETPENPKVFIIIVVSEWLKKRSGLTLQEVDFGVDDLENELVVDILHFQKWFLW